MSDDPTVLTAILDLNRTMGTVAEKVDGVCDEVKEFKVAYEKGKTKALEKAANDEENFSKLHIAVARKVDRKEIGLFIFLQKHWLKFGLIGSAGTGAATYRKAIAVLLGLDTE